VTGVATDAVLRRLDRAAMQQHLPQLQAWLLPDMFYGVQHTWPQLYRSDGRGRFLALFAGERMVAHVAFRPVTAVGERGSFRAALLGSVATAPEHRGHGLASRLLATALADCRSLGLDAVLLWAEHPTLYARAGFVAGAEEHGVTLARPAHADDASVRPLTIADHAAVHTLHEQKPWRITRTLGETSGLLTTPGMQTFVRVRDGAVVAYACCGKGADLQGWWHELGGSDAEVAALLPAAMAAMEQVETQVIVPPYRQELQHRLGRACRGTFTLAGPMLCALTAAGAQRCFVDGLDSV
jgi:predicted N-acetyltransferase YhbS